MARQTKNWIFFAGSLFAAFLSLLFPVFCFPFCFLLPSFFLSSPPPFLFFPLFFFSFFFPFPSFFFSPPPPLFLFLFFVPSTSTTQTCVGWAGSSRKLCALLIDLLRRKSTPTKNTKLHEANKTKRKRK